MSLSLYRLSLRSPKLVYSDMLLATGPSPNPPLSLPSLRASVCRHLQPMLPLLLLDPLAWGLLSPLALLTPPQIWQAFAAQPRKLSLRALASTLFFLAPSLLAQPLPWLSSLPNPRLQRGIRVLPQCRQALSRWPSSSRLPQLMLSSTPSRSCPDWPPSPRWMWLKPKPDTRDPRPTVKG